MYFYNLIIFYIFQCVKVVLIYGWMTVANIVRNPFASEAQDDINLMQKLDINIWKGSVAIKNIHEPPLAVVDADN